MKKIEIEEQVRNQLQSILETNNYELVDVEYVKEGANYYLRIYIDKENGVAIDDCEFVSRAIDKQLEEKNLIDNAYILEVSSPGLDRPLKKDEDFIKFKGRIVEIKLYKAIEKKKEFIGTLEGLIENKIVIVTEDGEQLSFDKTNVAITRLAILF